jgi:hypothetical protein
VLLNDLKTQEALSPPVIDPLISRYKAVSAKGYRTLEYDAVVREADDLAQSMRNQIEATDRILPSSDPAFDNYYHQMQEAEVDFAKALMQSLYPCIVTPQSDLNRLREYTSSRESIASQLISLKKQEASIKEHDSDGISTKIVIYNIWPFVLIIALCLKFGKGVAAWRKAMK